IVSAALLDCKRLASDDDLSAIPSVWLYLEHVIPFPLAPIRGSIPPLFTPFRNGEVDTTTYARMIEFQLREGSHGILVNGTTSEPASLTTEERNRLVTLAVEVVRGRVPVVAATGSQSLAETKLLTEHAAKTGADALL